MFGSVCLCVCVCMGVLLGFVCLDFFNEYMVVSTAGLGNYFGTTAEKMGGDYLCRGAVLRLLFLLFVKNCFSMIASFLG